MQNYNKSTHRFDNTKLTKKVRRERKKKTRYISAILYKQHRTIRECIYRPIRILAQTKTASRPLPKRRKPPSPLKPRRASSSCTCHGGALSGFSRPSPVVGGAVSSRVASVQSLDGRLHTVGPTASAAIINVSGARASYLMHMHNATSMTIEWTVVLSTD